MIRLSASYEGFDTMTANNFQVMKSGGVCTGWKAWKTVKKVYASNGILGVADFA
jgi:hypothetical protein